MEEIIEDETEKKFLFKADVTEFKIYKGSFPVIKPAKELTKKEIEEILKPKRKTFK